MLITHDREIAGARPGASRSSTGGSSTDVAARAAWTAGVGPADRVEPAARSRDLVRVGTIGLRARRSAHRADRARDRHRHRRDGRRRRHLGVEPGRRRWPSSTRSAPTCCASRPGQTAFGEDDDAAGVGPRHRRPHRPGDRGRRRHVRADAPCGATTTSPRASPAASPSSRPTSACSTRSAASCATAASSTTASSELPTVVLGADAADAARHRRPRRRRRGCGSAAQWFAVIGILEPAPLAPELDSAALIGYPSPTTLFETTHVAVDAVRAHGARPGRGGARRARPARSTRRRPTRSTCPGRPTRSRPGPTTDAALRNLLLALGAVALVVGGVGITNVMVISVLERRSEIGVRRALGARRVHIAGQFLVEAAVLAMLGGRRRRRARRRRDRALRRRRRAGSSTCRSPAARRRRRAGAGRRPRSPACPRRSAPPASTPPTPSARSDPVDALSPGEPRPGSRGRRPW